MKNEIERLLKGRGLKSDFKELSFNLKININYVCKETIKQRKAIYGNSFPEIAKLQSEYCNREITPRDIAMTLAILKKVRVDFIKSKLQELKDSPRFNDYDIQIQIKDLNTGLEDSIKDYNNYLWIAANYDEYEKL